MSNAPKKRRTAKSRRVCRHCEARRHSEFYTMCEASYAALLDGLAALREKQAARLRR